MKIYKKIHEAKKEIGAISKESTNPFFKSKYFDINTLIENVEPVLQKNGLLLLQPIQDGKVKTLIVDIETSESVESEMSLPPLNDPQKLGSAITYFRRYTLQSLLGLQAEDDDGNKAAKPAKVDYTNQINKLKACKDLKELQTVYTKFTPLEKTATLKLKDELKVTLK